MIPPNEFITTPLQHKNSKQFPSTIQIQKFQEPSYLPLQVTLVCAVTLKLLIITVSNWIM